MKIMTFYYGLLALLPIKHLVCFKILLSNSSVITNDFQYYKYMNRSVIEWQKEAKLLHYLLQDYNPNIIPRESKNESLKLYIGLAMSQLINIYDKEQVMKSNVWIHMWWKDTLLQWDHLDEFKDIISLRVPYDRVWTPDIILFNNAHGKYDPTHKCNVVLYKQGGVLWIPPSIYKSSCQIDVKYFPFDQQVCQMIFGSWVYDSDELTLDYFENTRYVDLNDYIPSGTWDILDVPASIEYYNDGYTNKSRVHMVYNIRMQRKSLFYVVNLIIPTFLISVLTVCLFFLPTNDGEKITLSLGLLFALVVFFLLISKIIPPTNIIVPLISKYLLVVFILNILSVFNTCVVISLYFTNLKLKHIHPWVITIFFKILPPILFIKRPKLNQTNQKSCELSSGRRSIYQSTLPGSYGHSAIVNDEIYSKLSDFRQNCSILTTRQKFLTPSNLYNFDKYKIKYATDCENSVKISSARYQNKNALKTNYVTLSNIQVTENIQSVSNSIQYISQLMKDKTEIESIREDWRYIASVLDRLMLFIFALVTFIGTYETLFDSPYIFGKIDLNYFKEMLGLES